MDTKQKRVYCHDCKKEIEMDGEDIKNGVFLVYDDGEDKVEAYKCHECFKKNPALTNFRECEVYSRVVGYIRPVSQWHVGKQQEYKDREEYKEPKNT